jgi:hypothetical protein
MVCVGSSQWSAVTVLIMGTGTIEIHILSVRVREIGRCVRLEHLKRFLWSGGIHFVLICTVVFIVLPI